MIEPGRIVELVKEGRDPLSLLLALRSDEDRKALAVCAVPRHFDREVYERVLAAAGASREFEGIVGDDFVRPVAGRPGWYQVREDVREKLLGEHPDRDGDRSALHAALLAHFESRGLPMAALEHRFAVDPESALGHWRRLFDEADARFDLAACGDLIELLGRHARGDRRLEQLHLDHDAHLRARHFWSEQFYQTGRFLQLTETRAAFERLLTGEGGRVLQINARGGTGKTMHLHWLVAREWVPRRIPCALIDFDFTSPIFGTQEPWLLLLKIASQLDQQLPGRPFQSLNREYGSFRQLLEVGTDRTLAAQVLPAGNARQELVSAIRDRFRDALREARRDDEPVVIIFDTLEEVLLRRNTEPERLIAGLAELHAMSPCLRLILSGRYDLAGEHAAHRVANYVETIGADGETLTLSGFDDEQAETYLRERRGVANPELVAAILAKLGTPPYIPLKVALFGDIVQQRPDLSPAEIRAYESADLVYLIERVVKRIEDDRVRWLLRYGVVPRRLTYEFAEAVLLPHVVREAGGRGRHDDPSRDALTHDAPADDSTFRKGAVAAGDELSLRALWNTLKRYASDSSWVSQQGDTLVFHGAVTRPMRRLLRGHEIHDLLHRDAVAYYEARAAAEPARWAELICEAIYHRFQYEGADAEAYWVARGLEARQAHSIDERLRIAAEPLGDDYRSGDTIRDGRPLVRADTQVQAQFSLATLYLEQARAETAPSLRRQLVAQAREALDGALGREAAELEAPFLPPSVVGLRRAEILFLEERFGEAEKLLEALAGQLTDDGQRREHAWLSMMVQSRLGTLDAEEVVALADQAAGESGDPFAQRILIEAVSYFITRDEIRHAETALARLCAAVAQEPDDQSLAKRRSLDHLRAELYFKYGRFHEIEEAFDSRNYAGDFPAWIRYTYWVVRARLAAGDPKGALGRVRSVVADIEGSLRSTHADAALEPALRQGLAEGYELTGAALTELMSASRSVDVYERAQQLWRELADPAGQARVFVARSRLALRLVGDLREAGQQLDLADSFARQSEAPDWPTLATLATLRAEWLERSGRHDQAAEDLRRSLEEIRSQGAPGSLWGPLAATGMAIGLSDFAPMLAEALASIPAHPLRLMLLEPFADPLRPAVVEAPVAERLSDLVRAASLDGLDERDRAMLHLRRLDLHRCLGLRDLALEEFRLALPLAESSLQRESAWPLRRWLRAAWGLDQLEVVDALFERHCDRFVREHGKDYRLCAVFYLEQAEREFYRGRFDAAEGLLATSADRFEGLPAHTVYRGRLAELQAWLAGARGHDHDAALFHGAAVQIYQSLDDRAAIDRIESQSALDRADDTRQDDEKLPGRTVEAGPVIVLRRDEKEGLVLQALGDGETHTATADANEALFGSLLKERSAAVFDYDVARRLAEDHRRFATLLGDLLTSVSSSPAPLHVEAAEVACLPWELALTGGRDGAFLSDQAPECLYRTWASQRVDGARVRFLQQALSRHGEQRLPADGIYGPATRRSAAALLDAEGVAMTADGADEVPAALAALRQRILRQENPAGRVLILRPSLYQSSQTTSAGGSGGAGLEDVYRKQGLDAFVLEDPAIGELRGMMQKLDPVRALHVRGHLKERGGYITLDFSGEEWGLKRGGSVGDVEEFSTTILADILQSLSSDAPRPLLVLEITQPRGRAEIARQLLLRNAFAHELFQYDSTGAIVATGLAPFVQEMTIAQALAEALGSRASVGELIGLLRTRLQANRPGDVENFEDFVGAGATALFADFPERCWWE